MVINISDRNIDRKLEELCKRMEQEFGFPVSKADAIRFLLKIKKQGKKTHRRWKDLI